MDDPVFGICEGGENGARACPAANRCLCTACAREWEPELWPNSYEERLSKYTGNCPQCDSSAIKALRCDTCPVLEVEHQRMVSPAGRLLDRVTELRRDIEEGIETPPVTAEEAMALKVMREESARLDYERVKKQREEEELEKRANESQARVGKGQGVTIKRMR